MSRAEHGGSGALYNAGCRCVPCRIGHRERMHEQRQIRFALRVLTPDGYLIHPHVKVHNRMTYNNWGCRCPECRKSHSEYMLEINRARNARRRNARREAENRPTE